MITGEIKNKIDKIWEVFWTGGLTNPLSVMEQISYLLFIKLLDDSEIIKESNYRALGANYKSKLFVEGKFKLDEENTAEIGVNYKDLRWSNFKHFEPNKMFNTVRNYAFEFIKRLSGDKDTAFSNYIKDAVFLIQTPRTLVKIIDGLSDLDLNNKDIMGDVYEYLLSKLSTSGKNGQFRTPRHIIKMMVDLMKPTLNDVIVDPAMGSAGFLVESAKYITENYEKELMQTENRNKFNKTMFNGFDTDPTMLRIGAMNMMLHDVEEANIQFKDSLSEDNTDIEKYSLVLANPPFKGSLDYEVVSKDLLALTKTKKTEILFLSLFLKILKLGGRGASIVPDGVLFGASKAHKQIRKELIENQKLEAVISMPSGVFKPYAGVSTAILIFTKTNAGGTDKVWFYDMQADGYSLDDKRDPVKENDIPDLQARFSNLKAEEKRTRKDKSFFVTKQELIEEDYDLSLNKYKEIEREVIVYEKPEIVLNRIEQLEKAIQDALQEFKKSVKE